MHINPDMAATMAPPVMEARRWISGVTFPPDRPLINVSQAAPVAPPPEAMRAAMAEMVMRDPTVHLYGPVLGLPELREEVARRTARIYGGQIALEQVAITAGCNEAFTAILATLAGPGDEVILPTPWYFNHKMALDMAGVGAVPLPSGPGLIPDPQAAGALITPATRALVLVSPNNPGGAEYPADVIAAFRDLARARGIALIIDETYRDFHSGTGAPHSLFSDPDWDETVIHLYSFSKAYRLTGHRVGAILASPARLAQVEKYLDTVTICPPQLGQRAALWGMQNLDQWLAGERDEILSRRATMEAGLATLDGWSILGCGAYFAYVKHPYEMSSAELAPALVHAAGILMLPGTMFRPETDASGAGEMRIAFANADAGGIATLITRLAQVDPAHLAAHRPLT
ncbi:MAG: aminotransferase [Rhodobacteraceae bacterium]|nr:aminotransferase [Paracoccaceae bacterium]